MEELYTPEDMAPRSLDVSSERLKGTIRLATGEETPEYVPYEETIDRVWQSVAMEQQQEDRQLIQNLAASGKGDLLQQALLEMQTRSEMLAKRTSESYEETYQKVLDVSRRAAENIALSQADKNTPQEVSVKADEVAKRNAALIDLERQITEVTDVSGWKQVGGFLHAFTFGTFDIVSMRNIIEENPDLTGARKGEYELLEDKSEMIHDVQRHLRQFPVEERLKRALNLSLKFKDSFFISDAETADVFRDLVSAEDVEDRYIADTLAQAGIIAFPLTILGAGIRVANRLSKASTFDMMARDIAEAGGKRGLEASEMVDTAKRLAAIERAKAVGDVALELSGIQGVLDTGKLVSTAAAKVLPEAITSSASEAAKIVRNQISKTVDDLNSVLRSDTIKAADVKAEIIKMERTYSTANNPTVHSSSFRISDDGKSIVGSVLYKPKGMAAFTDAKIAEEANQKLYGGAGKVVPDSTNTKFYVEAEVEQALEAEKLSLLAELARPVRKTPSKGSKTASKAETKAGEGVGSQTPPKPVVEAPSALKTSKPKYGLPQGAGNLNLTFADDVDKAAYIVASKGGPTKADPEITNWLKQTTGWSDAQIKAHGEVVRNNVKAASKSVDVFDSGKYSVPKLSPEVSVSGKGEVTDDVIVEDVSLSLFNNNKLITYREGSIGISNSIAADIVLPFHKKLAAKLGLDKRPLLVLQEADLDLTDPAQAAVKAMLDKQGNVKGIHYGTYHGSVIIMRQPVSKMGNLAYFELFAHEYFHYFQAAYFHMHNDTFRSLFSKWLTARGIKHTRVVGKDIVLHEQLPIDAVFEYNGITTSNVMTEDFINRYFAGSKSAFNFHAGNMHRWFQDHNEFTAEQFSKWATTSETAETILGQMFTGLIAGLREITTEFYNMASRLFGRQLKPFEETFDGFMKRHMEFVKNGQAIASRTKPITVNEGPTKLTKAAANRRLLQIQEELAAIKAAKSGLKHGYFVEMPVNKSITYDMLKSFDPDDVARTLRFGLGDWQLTVTKDTLDSRLIGDHANSAYHKILTNFVRKPIESLNTQEFNMVNDALVRGDAEGREFLEAELKGEGFTQKAIEAYYTVRAARNITYQVRNTRYAQVLTNKGFTELRFASSKMPEETGRLFGKPLENAEGIAYDVAAGKATSISSKPNAVVYELPYKYKIGNRLYDKVLVNADEVSTHSITEVIPYRKGEYSRIYTDQYFVKINVTYGDKDQVIKQTHRTAKFEQDASAYARDFNNAVDMWKSGLITPSKISFMEKYGWDTTEFIAKLDSGEWGLNPQAEALFTRTDDDFVTETLSAGGLISKSRGEHIPNVFGETNTASPLDSLAAEISNTSYVASALEWREGQIARWWETFKGDFPSHIQQMGKDDAFYYVMNSDLYQGTNHRQAVARNVAQYIRAQLGIKTQEEKFYAGAAKLMAEAVEKRTDLPGVEHIGLFLRKTENWPQFVRGVAYVSYMGAFNIKHFFMQSMNAFNATMISPQYGLQAAKTGALVGIASFNDNEAIWRRAARVNKFITAGMGMSEDEFVEVVRAIKRTGLLDGVGFNTMYGMEGGKYGIFNQVSRNISNVSSAPTNVGDGYARIVAFDIARREWKAANPGKPWMTDDALRQILVRQDLLTQSMTTANKAKWQTGFASIPTQFTQYFIKMFTHIADSVIRGEKGRGLTRKDVAFLMLGHTMFLGLAGWSVLPEEWLDEQTKNLSETARISLQQGLIAGVLNHITEGEMQLAIGGTFGTANFYADTINNLSDPERTSFLEVVAGPGGNAIFNWMGKVGKVLEMPFTREVDEGMLRDMLLELSTGFSSVNNMTKAILAANSHNYMLSKGGNKMYDVTNMELYAESIGIHSLKKYETDKLIRHGLNRDNEIKSVAKEIGGLRARALAAENNNDTQEFERLIRVGSAMMAIYRETDHKAYVTLRNELHKYETTTRFDRELIKNMKADVPVPNMLINKPFEEK
jgi:hypothetical protein